MQQQQQTSVSQLEAILVNFFDSLQSEVSDFPSCSSFIESAESRAEVEDSNVSTLSSLSLLHLAAALNMPSLVRRLLLTQSSVFASDSGISVKGHLVDKHGASALDWALALGHFEVAALLREDHSKGSQGQKKPNEEHLSSHQWCGGSKSLATSIVIDQPLLSSASRQQKQQMASESPTTATETDKKKEKAAVVVVVKMENAEEEEEEEDILLDNVSLQW